jgi:hypothetical protein
MAIISVTKLSDSTYEVAVQGTIPTKHTVTVSADYASRLTGGHVATEHLVSRSFDFLLERESNTSILRHFDLRVIGHYFPEYERVIRGML